MVIAVALLPQACDWGGAVCVAEVGGGATVVVGVTGGVVAAVCADVTVAVGSTRDEALDHGFKNKSAATRRRITATAAHRTQVRRRRDPDWSGVRRSASLGRLPFR